MGSVKDGSAASAARTVGAMSDTGAQSAATRAASQTPGRAHHRSGASTTRVPRSAAWLSSRPRSVVMGVFSFRCGCGSAARSVGLAVGRRMLARWGRCGPEERRAQKRRGSRRRTPANPRARESAWSPPKTDAPPDHGTGGVGVHPPRRGARRTRGAPRGSIRLGRVVASDVSPAFVDVACAVVRHVRQDVRHPPKGVLGKSRDFSGNTQGKPRDR